MIKTKNSVPEVYYNRSRDFQLLGRIYDIIFNYLKTNVQILDTLPYSEDIDDKLIPLLSTTLGFKQTHEYNTQQLKVVCSSFIHILRNKGNFSAITELLQLLANVENTQESYQYTVDDDNPYVLNIYLPLSISDTSLFEDMLYYVLPAGMSYRIIKQLIIENKPSEDTVFIASDRSTISLKTNYNLLSSQITQQEVNEYLEKSTSTGLGRIEDMHVIQYPRDEAIQVSVKKDQEESPEDVELPESQE